MIRLALVLMFVALLASQLLAVDVDTDGIDDAHEQALLARHSPYWVPHDNNQRPPLPLDWYVRHCQLRWYDKCDNPSSSPGRRLGDSGSQVLTLDQLATRSYADGHFYRLAFKNAAFRNGNDSQELITWSGLQNNPNSRVVLGRVARVPGSLELYTVMYFLVFGYNVTDAPNNALGICTDWGDHEGDVIGVEFTVFSSSPLSSSRVVSAVYNNHGRKIFIDDATGLEYLNNRPKVYLERESQEPWPVRGECGFGQVVTSPVVGTNKVFEATEVAGWSFGGECEDWQAVREHLGNGTPFAHTNVINLGEKGLPMNAPEARFLDAFGGPRSCGSTVSNAGRLGDYANNEICICYVAGQRCFGYKGNESPMGPSAQSKMWNPSYDQFNRASNFPGKPQGPVSVQIERESADSCTVRVTVVTKAPGPCVLRLETDHPGLTFASPYVQIPSGSSRGTATGTLSLAATFPAVIRVWATAVPPAFTDTLAIPFHEAFSHLSAEGAYWVGGTVTQVDATRSSNATAPIVVTWKKACGANGYSIYRDDDLFPIAMVPDAGTLWQSYSDASVTSCIPHRYQIQALYASGPSERSPTAVGFAGLAFKDILLSTDFLTGRMSLSGRVELWASVTSPAVISLFSSDPGVLQVPGTVNMPSGSSLSAFFPVETFPVPCVPGAPCEPVESKITAQSSICEIVKPYWVHPTETWPEINRVASNTYSSIPNSGNKPKRVLFHDMDGDGADDLVIQSNRQIFPDIDTGSVTIWKQDALTAVYGPLDSGADILIGNVDGDSVPDIVGYTASSGSGGASYTYTLRTVRNPGTGASISAPTIGAAGALVALKDLTGDGLDDAIMSSGRIHPSIGNGQFGASFIPAAGDTWSGVFADLDGDAILDRVLASSTNNSAPNIGKTWTIRAFRGLGNGVYDTQALPAHTHSTSPQDVGDIIVRDLDGDGSVDLLYAKTQLVNTATAYFAPPGLHVIYNWGTTKQREVDYRLREASGAPQITVEDIDLDGDLDLLAQIEGVAGVPGSSTLLMLFRYHPLAGYAAPLELPTNVNTNFAQGDWDGDGDKDLAYYFNNNVELHLNNTRRPAPFQAQTPDSVISTATGSIGFRWTRAAAADYYRIEVSSNPQFTQIVASANTAGLTATLQVPLLHETEHYWRVQAVNTRGSETAYPGVTTFEMFDLNTIDCNANGRYDTTDIQLGSSLDANANGLPDECERPPCRADFNGIGGLTPADIFDFLNAWFMAQPTADFDGSGTIAPADIFEFLNAWFVGCP